MFSSKEDTLPLVMPKLTYGSYTSKGKRDENQDALITVLAKNNYTFAVADGAGGHSFGKETSNMTVNAIKDELEHETSSNIKYIELLIRKKYDQINSHIYNLQKQMGKTMITTLSMINIVDDCFLASNIGDTKIFQIRSGEISLISKVHNKAWEMYENNLITYEEYENHRSKNILTKAMGAFETVEPYFKTGKVMANDIYIICTDGVHNYITEEEIVTRFSRSNKFSNEELNKICFDICEVCLKNHSNDNLSIIAFQV